jgi:hypothetical protein
MKNTFSLITVTIWMLYSIQTVSAQKAERIIITDDAIAQAQTNSQKGEKDTTRQKEIIIIQKKLGDKQIELLDRQKELLDRQKELKDLQSLGQQDKRFFGYQGFIVGAKDIFELRLKKSFNGESAETTKKFSISPDYNSLNFNLSGQVKSGVISVTLIKPNGKKFKSIEIDPTSDVSFAQGIDLKKDSKEWIGDWQINIRAKKADGNYLLTIQTR